MGNARVAEYIVRAFIRDEKDEDERAGRAASGASRFHTNL
jgi:hypothetical protein